MVLAHGAGSSPDVVRRLLAPFLPAGARVVAPVLRGGIEDSMTVLDAAGRDHEVVLAAGISLGAHALARLAAARGSSWPLALVMPAWTGAPADVAGATRAAADDLERRGRAAVLTSIAQDPATRDDWVRAELDAAWAEYDDDALVAALRAAAASAGPSERELASLRAPVAVVGLADDPLHPELVARAWAATIPRAGLLVVPRHEPGSDSGALGRAAAQALAGLNGSR